MKKRLLSLFLVFVLTVFHPVNMAFAVSGDNAVFSFAALNGKTGENEVKLVVNTDSALINHLIFDIVDPTDSLVFNITGTNDPVSFPLTGQSVLGTEVTFTTASGDKGYDLASGNPTSTGAYTALHFATLITDKNLTTGAGGILRYDADTAIYVNAQRKGTYSATYTVLPNVAPTISSSAVDGVSLTTSTTAPSAATPLPTNLVQNVAVGGTFTYSVSDSTDASVSRQMKVYKRLSNGSWGYPTSATYTRTIARNSTDMTFSSTAGTLDFASYYKVEFIVADDQGAGETKTFYFVTQPDNIAPSQVGKAITTFISDSNTRTDVLAQVSFQTTTDNSGVDAYYLWTKKFLIAKDIINTDGTRDLSLDTGGNGAVSDEEFYVGLRSLVSSSHYVAKVTSAVAATTPYFRVTGSNVDGFDNRGTTGSTADDLYYVPDSISEDIFYVVAADVAQDVSGNAVPNFSAFQVIDKEGDVFGGSTVLSVGGQNRSYVTGDGGLDVWDAIYLYRNAIGLASQYPLLRPDMLNSGRFSLPSNISSSGSS